MDVGRRAHRSRGFINQSLVAGWCLFSISQKILLNDQKDLTVSTEKKVRLGFIFIFCWTVAQLGGGDKRLIFCVEML